MMMMVETQFANFLQLKIIFGFSIDAEKRIEERQRSDHSRCSRPKRINFTHQTKTNIVC